MRTVRVLLLGVVGILGVAFVAAPVAQAQVKPAVGADPDGKDAAADKNLKHGNRLAVTMKGGRKLVGTLVRTDNDALYLRTTPGMPPTRVARGELAKWERTAAPAGTDPALKGGAEIHAVEVYAGSVRTVRYIAPNLSPEERARLAEMEAAENNLAQAETTTSLGQQAALGELQLQSARIQAQANFLNYSALSSLGFFPGTVVNYPQYGRYNYIGAPYYLGGGYGLPGYGGNNRHSWGSITEPAVAPGLAFFPETGLSKSLQTQAVKAASPETVVMAKQRLAQVNSAAIYEDGRLIAVSLDGQAEYKRGDRISVTPKNGKAMTGTVERMDGDVLMLRTQPGMPPMMLRLANIESIEPLARPAANP